MHWFWRATIAVVLGTVSCFALQGIYTLLNNLNGTTGIGLGEWVILFVFFLLPAVVTAVASYGVLTHFFRPNVGRRLALNQCPRCSYDLTGNVSGVCPECGERI
jgi:hypothetical protein